MTAFGIYDAKTRLSELIDRVNATGEGITITKRGRPVAELVPSPANGRTRMSKEGAMAELRDLWSTMPPVEPGEIKRLIDEGRE